jgi:hypothetical protein
MSTSVKTTLPSSESIQINAEPTNSSLAPNAAPKGAAPAGGKAVSVVVRGLDKSSVSFSNPA